ncbi:MAG: N-acetylglucosamine kinase, partial [Clostridia bacterium]|nr:N-acetylglucosamine kinase [Clostridia bacterium]
MKWFIGLDGGGTKTLAVLCDETGFVHARAAKEATNPTSVARELVVQRLAGLLDTLLADIGGRQGAIEGGFGGFGGFGDMGFDLG